MNCLKLSFGTFSRRSLLVTCATVMTAARSVRGQGLTPNANGHAALNGKAIVACWNFAAGQSLPEDFSRYLEFLPFVHGWDFRMNLPHIHFNWGVVDERRGWGAGRR